jgi:hypothetical protein
LIGGDWLRVGVKKLRRDVIVNGGRRLRFTLGLRPGTGLRLRLWLWLWLWLQELRRDVRIHRSLRLRLRHWLRLGRGWHLPRRLALLRAQVLRLVLYLPCPLLDDRIQPLVELG